MYIVFNMIAFNIIRWKQFIRNQNVIQNQHCSSVFCSSSVRNPITIRFSSSQPSVLLAPGRRGSAEIYTALESLAENPLQSPDERLRGLLLDVCLSDIKHDSVVMRLPLFVLLYPHVVLNVCDGSETQISPYSCHKSSRITLQIKRHE